MAAERPHYQDRITTDPTILVGKPVIRGTRIAVEHVLEQLAVNPDLTELFAAYPDLTTDDEKAALAYARDVLSWWRGLRFTFLDETDGAEFVP